jgi:type VII secretion protein EccB
MPSRQDQLHSYQFSVQRVVAALVMRETDPAQSPFRRVAGATMAGAIVAALALAGAAVYGLYAGGSGDWRKEGQVIIEKESGTRYVYYNGDRKLHPVINYASALLLADAARPQVVTWSQATLEGASRGAPMGIPGAPDSLPDARHLARPPWTLCSQQSGDTSDGSGTEPRSVLFVGGVADGGRALAPARAATRPEGLLVSTPDGRRYLVYDNHRHQLVQSDQVLRAFFWSTKPTVQVSPALINALPAGPDLRPLPIPGRGGRSTALPGAKVGQVYHRKNAGETVQHAVALADGLAEITEAQADLLLADPETPIGPQGRDTELPGYSSAVQSKNGLAAAPPFPQPPDIRSAAGSVCLSIPDANGVDKVVVDAKLPDQSRAATTPARTGSGAFLADRVVVSGRGALVAALASPAAPGGALSIVSDLGIRYPLASRDLVAKLGYEGVTPVAMPAELVALLPVGPALDPQEARQSQDPRK